MNSIISPYPYQGRRPEECAKSATNHQRPHESCDGESSVLFRGVRFAL
jgi:hypothetical protein